MLKYRVLAVVASSIFFTVSACDDESLDIDVEKFNATLNGSSAVPPVTTSATGTAELTVNGNFLGARIELSMISGVTTAHLHRGAAGQVATAPMATLFTQAAPGTGDVNGLLTYGTVNIPDSVVAHIRNGTAYVDVHTAASGTSPVVRGQVTPE